MFPYFYPQPIPTWYNYYNYYYFNKPAAFSHDELDDEDRMARWAEKDEYMPKGKMIEKDSFVPGFVPNHNHASVDYTSVEAGHVHQCLDITYPPTPSENGTHSHYTEGYVLFENGHTHYYKACSGPAIPVGDGIHVHYYDFYTSENMGHRHHVTGVDKPAPGKL